MLFFFKIVLAIHYLEIPHEFQDKSFLPLKENHSLGFCEGFQRSYEWHFLIMPLSGLFAIREKLAS